MNKFKFILDNNRGETQELSLIPSGWSEFEYKFTRSVELKSVSKVFSDKILRFVKDKYVDWKGGYNFIKAEYDLYGTDFNITMVVQYYNHMTAAYDEILSTKLDTTGNITWDKNYLDINVTESSVMAKFNARNELEINPNTTTDLDGNTITALLPEYVDAYTEDLALEARTKAETFLYQASTHGDINLLAGFTPPYNYNVLDVNTIGNRVLNENQWLYLNDTDESIRVKSETQSVLDGSIVIRSFDGSTFDVTISVTIIIDLNGTVSFPIYSNYQTITVTGSDQTIDYDFDGYYFNDLEIEPTKGIEIKPRIVISTPGTNDVISTILLYFDFFPFLVEIYSPVEDFYNVPVYFTYPLFSKLLEITTGYGTLDAASIQRIEDGALSYGEYSLLTIGNGFMFRNFPIGKAGFTVSLQKLIQSFYAVCELGVWFNGSAWEIKPLVNFYQDVLVWDFGEVTGFSTSAEDDLFFNEIQSGYKNKVDFEDVNGLEEYNVQTEFSTAIKYNKGVLDIQSEIDGSGTQVELELREPYELTAAEDFKTDKNTMFLQCRKDGEDFRSDNAEDFSLVENVFDPTRKKNLKLTPKRNLLKHGPEINSMYWKKSDEFIYFRDSQLNSDLITQVGVDDPVIQENTDIEQTDLSKAYYDPEIYTFEAECGIDAFNAIKANPHGYFKFTSENVEYYGYIREIPVNLKKEKAEVTLIKKHGVTTQSIFSDVYSQEFTQEYR